MVADIKNDLLVDVMAFPFHHLGAKFKKYKPANETKTRQQKCAFLLSDHRHDFSRVALHIEPVTPMAKKKL